MDIVTHAMMGVIIASPLVPAAPLTASCLIVGSVVPDLDVLCRIFGKRAFMICHQTYSHSLLAIICVACAFQVLQPTSLYEPWAGPALGAGMFLHSFTDVSNTYGIALFLPFSRRRFSFEWVFFIDAIVLLASVVCSSFIAWRWMNSEPAGPLVASIYGAFLSLYWIVKIALRRSALSCCPSKPLSLIPSALFPWRFYGCSRSGNEVGLFTVNAITKEITEERSVTIFDEEFAAKLHEISEFNIMRELSNGFHVVDTVKNSNGVQITCRDLRTRNFNTRFGGLDVTLDISGAVTEVNFHV